MADSLRSDLGVDVQLVRGRGGIFEVKVDGKLVASKQYGRFPEDVDVIAAVKAATGR